jgi:hypothetical protein
MAASQPVVIASNQTAIPVTGTLTTTLGTISDTSKGREYTSYSPSPKSYPGIVSELSLDYSDNLMVRGQALTDELSFRDDFTGSSLTRSLTGNIQWGGNDTHVVGTGSCLFTTQVKAGDYIKKASDAESAWTQVDYIESDNSLYLVTGYLGTNGTSTGQVSDWKPSTPTGASLTVTGSVLSIASGTTSGNQAGVTHGGDYLPYNLGAKITLSQRIANQVTTLGFVDSISSPTLQAAFIFDGTTNTTVKCRTSSSSAATDTEEYTVTLPNGTTAGSHYYNIDVTSTQVVFTVDGTVVSTHRDHIPGPYDDLSITANIKNNASVTATTLAVDFITFLNSNQLEITSGFRGESFRIIPGAFPTTYSASVVGVASAASATDIFTITGSDTKTVRIKKVRVSATQTTGGAINVLALKRSTANTAGTSTTITAASHDSSNTAATAVVRAYTANPTVGTLVGNVMAAKLFVPATTGAPQLLEMVMGGNYNQEIVLRGSSQVFAINLNAVTVSGGNFNFAIEWVESND